MPPCPRHTLPGHSCILFFGKCLFSLFPFVFVLLILILCEFWSRLPCHKLSWQHCLPCGGCYPSPTPPYHRVFLCCAEVHSLEASLSLCHVLICCLRASPELFFFPSQCPEVFLPCFPLMASSGSYLALASEDWREVATLLPPGFQGPSSTGASSRRLHQKTLELGVGWKHRHTVNYGSTLGAILIKAGPCRSQDLKFSLL